MSSKCILLLEPFYGGSHKQLMDLVYSLVSDSAELFTLPPKKWHWKSLTSSLNFADIIPKHHNFRVMFTSSVLPLAHLIAIRPDLAHLHKIVYFHENQLTYPVREMKMRYFQHGFNELLTCLTADKIIFNSNYNKESFLSSLTTYFNIIPDYRPACLEEKIRSKCSVLYFPIVFPLKVNDEKLCEPATDSALQTNSPLHIVWPHRWEHDKNPESFFSVIFRLKESGASFNISVIGETFSEKSRIFDEAYSCLKDNIVNWGYKESREEYLSVLMSADVVVSTAEHEFFGVSMLEATSLNCYPLCPKRLVYTEIYPENCLYNTLNQLYKKLKYFCCKPYIVRNSNIPIDFSKFSWNNLSQDYRKLFTE